MRGNTVAVVAYQPVKEILEKVEAGCLLGSLMGFSNVRHVAEIAPHSCLPAVMVQIRDAGIAGVGCVCAWRRRRR